MTPANSERPAHESSGCHHPTDRPLARVRSILGRLASTGLLLAAAWWLTGLFGGLFATSTEPNVPVPPPSAALPAADFEPDLTGDWQFGTIDWTVRVLSAGDAGDAIAWAKSFESVAESNSPLSDVERQLLRLCEPLRGQTLGTVELLTGNPLPHGWALLATTNTPRRLLALRLRLSEGDTAFEFRFGESPRDLGIEKITTGNGTSATELLPPATGAVVLARRTREHGVPLCEVWSWPVATADFRDHADACGWKMLLVPAPEPHTGAGYVLSSDQSYRKIRVISLPGGLWVLTPAEE